MNAPHIVIPDSGKELVRRELAFGFEEAGFRASRIAPEVLGGSGENSLAALTEAGSVFLCSVNFQGLENPRPVLEMLAARGGSAAVWCVDNPWNLLAGVRDPRWRTLPFFVTDAAFLPGLKRAGAEKVFYLPLGACFESMGQSPAREKLFPPPEDAAPLLFVGRSEFPGKARFFEGIEVPKAPAREAEEMLPQGGRPDWLWWEERTGLADIPLWPGKKARVPALGAENAGILRRALCLNAAARAFGAGGAAGPAYSPVLDIYGDSGWAEMLPPHSRLRPPVDYYTRLPGLYAKARYTLNVTGLPLPKGLTQRHFDVWTAGGVCITDDTPGLALFPQELTRPVTFSRPADIPSLAEKLEGADRAGLIRDWQILLRAEHSYRHRAEAMLAACGLL